MYREPFLTASVLKNLKNSQERVNDCKALERKSGTLKFNLITEIHNGLLKKESIN